MFSRSQQHLADLRDVFSRLQKAGLMVNLKKCSLFQGNISVSGHVISSVGIVTQAKKVEAVKSFPTLRSVKNVERFLSVAECYHRFIPHYADRSAPLNALKR